MSFSLDIYFPQIVFPLDPWERIVAEHGLQRLDPDSAASVVDVALSLKWAKALQGFTLFADLDPWTPDTGSPCAPPGARWLVTLDTALGRPKRLLWTQFAIVYHVLVLVESVAVHDCQYHLKTTRTGSTFTDPDAWEAFVAQEYGLTGLGDRIATD